MVFFSMWFTKLRSKVIVHLIPVDYTTWNLYAIDAFHSKIQRFHLLAVISFSWFFFSIHFSESQPKNELQSIFVQYNGISDSSFYFHFHFHFIFFSLVLLYFAPDFFCMFLLSIHLNQIFTFFVAGISKQTIFVWENRERERERGTDHMWSLVAHFFPFRFVFSNYKATEILKT